MKVTIHQPEFMPYGGFFAKVMRSDVFIIADRMQAKKNYFENRNRFLIGNQASLLTVPMRQKGRLTSTIADIDICEDGRWRRKLLRSLSQNYGAHPFFQLAFEIVEDAIAREKKLAELNVRLITEFLRFMEIRTAIVRMSNLLLSEQKGSPLLAQMVRLTNGTTYISGPSGRDYLDMRHFAGIEVVFHGFHAVPYKQPRRKEFVPNLSIFDILCCCGPEEARNVLLKGSTLHAMDSLEQAV